MDEARVKAAALSYVRKMNGRRRKPIVTAEFSLGSSGVRADLAVFAEENIGFEIKTSRDTLRRLSSQMRAYSQYFEHSVAIVARCHLRNLTVEHLYGASVWTYDEVGEISVLHVGAKRTVEEEKLDDLLTQMERRKRVFKAAMEARYGETSQQFWEAVSRRPIRADDLPLLSRFADSRQRARLWASERDTRWSHWLAAQAQVAEALA